MVDTDDTRRTIDGRRRTTPRVWHKLPTGELKMVLFQNSMQQPAVNLLFETQRDVELEKGFEDDLIFEV